MQIGPSSAKPEINEKVCNMLKLLLYAVLPTSLTNMSDSSTIKMQLLSSKPCRIADFAVLKQQLVQQFILMILKLLTFIQ